MKKKTIKLKLFNIFVLLSACLGTLQLLHDLIIWAIIPFFTGKYVMLTYFGMFVDLASILLIEMAIQYIKE